MGQSFDVVVIGGGAAGFFAAVMVKANYPMATVTLYEKTSKVLAKVAISGGGRCNVTNGSTSIKELAAAYPRGRQLMKKLLPQFSTADIRKWFEDRSVPLKVEADGRVFPVSDKSKSIVDCLVNEAHQVGVEIKLSHAIKSIKWEGDQFQLYHKEGAHRTDKVIVATGGSPKRIGLEWIAALGHEVIAPVPSLFTFNMPGNDITNLMGVSVPNALVRIQGSKMTSIGPLLITHWGMSGPAILKLSAFGAQILHDLDYNFTTCINWTGIKNENSVLEELTALAQQHPKKQIINVRPFVLPERLWHYLLHKSKLNVTKEWVDVGKKDIHKMVTILTNDDYDVRGKTTFKEEFVTCGGISLESINQRTLESNAVPNLYFAGEILNIDGITGGYNFQAAWTTAFVAAKLGKTS